MKAFQNNQMTINIASPQVSNVYPMEPLIAAELFLTKLLEQEEGDDASFTLLKQLK